MRLALTTWIYALSDTVSAAPGTNYPSKERGEFCREYEALPAEGTNCPTPSPKRQPACALSLGLLPATTLRRGSSTALSLGLVCGRVRLRLVGRWISGPSDPAVAGSRGGSRARSRGRTHRWRRSVRTCRDRRGIGDHSRCAGICRILQVERQNASVSMIQRLDASLGVLDTVARLPFGVVVDPFGPTGPTMRGHDMLVEIEPVAMLESHVALVDELHARTTGRQGQRRICCRACQQAG